VATEDREREFRLRPPRPLKPKDEPRAWTSTFKRIMHYARMSSRCSKSKRTPVPHSYQQRCAVRVTYSPNRSPGQWAAHGRYLSRESAMHNNAGTAVAFGPSGPVSDISATLRNWQTAGDPRLFKIIISPEFGDRCDLEQLTRDLASKMEADLGTRLEWVATPHYNTEHPHVHMALRGITEDKQPLRLDRQYIRYGIRAHAENLVTRQLGYRTILDAEDAERREIQQTRYTSLDRVLNRNNTATQSGAARTEVFAVDLRKLPASSRQHHLKARLLFLEKLELAHSNGSNRWLVRSDFQTILQAMQNTVDRQRALAQHGSLLSDTRLPIRLTDAKQLQQSLEGRVLGHVEDERTGRAYMILEGTDQNVHFIWHTAEIESARHQRKVASNSFVRITPRTANGRTVLLIADLGPSEELLNNTAGMRNRAQALINRGIVPVENGWGGWLGRYQNRLAHAFQELVQPRTLQRDSDGPGFSR
jgi:type IV secretory pathway VirD2 relaxase